MHQLFSIPELAIGCLSNLSDDKGALNACARTCRHLSNAAIPILWSELDSAFPLLRLLGLSKATSPPQTEGQWAFFPNRPGPKEWSIFETYSKLVTRFTCPPSTSYKGQVVHFGPSVFSVFSLSRPVKPLLPNLKHITIRTTTPQHQLEALLWLSPSIQDLHVHLGRVDALNSALFVSELPGRCPNIKSLSIHYHVGFQGIEQSVIDCLSGLQHLEEVTLPPGFIQIRLFQTLSRPPRLRKIAMHSSSTVRDDTFILYSIMLWEFSPTFPQLSHFAIHSPLSSATTLFRSLRLMPSLKTLEVTSSNDVNLEHTKQFFSAAVIAYSSRAMANLTSIRLDLDDHTNASILRFSFSHLLPLLDHHGITHFFIRHRHPYLSTSEELVQLLVAWPNLTELSLCADPRPPTAGAAINGPGLSLGALYIFAEHGSNLRELGCYIDSSLPYERPLPKKRLENIERLHVGTSPAPKDPFSLALILGELCDSRMVIEFGKRKIPPSSNASNGDAGTKQAWENVGNRFKDVARMRDRVCEQERARLRGLSARLSTSQVG